MRKTVCLILILAMCISLTACGSGADDLMESVTPKVTPVEYIPGEEGEIVTDFGLRLFREAYDPGENTLISPLSVLCALSMTANGARNETLAQMEDVLGLDVPMLNNWISAYMAALPESEDAKLSLANAIWFKDAPTLTVEETFLQTNADYYGAGIYKAAFDDATKNDINRWVEENTDGMVKDILDEISQEAVMYLVNALAFDARWQEIYEDNQIREGTFTTPNDVDVNVEMMHSQENQYLEDACATGFLKYYAGGDYAFAALLPNEGISVEEYLESLTGEGLRSMLENADNTTVQVAMPKFELEYSVEMSELLKSMGMTDAFDGGLADFSGIGTSVEGNLYINRVLHKTYICVDGKGTRAGAATAVEVNCESAAEPNFYVVNLDRPFVYMLIDTKTKLPFFMGVMNDPGGEVIPEPVLESPPELTVTCGNDSYTVQTGNCSWSAPGGPGEMGAFIACGAHPLDNIDSREFRVIEGNSILLSFPVEPDELTVRCWPGSDVGNVDAAGENVTLDGSILSVEKGDWVFEIIARWERDTWGGEASYHLYISR